MPKYSGVQKDMIAAILRRLQDNQQITLNNLFGEKINDEVLSSLKKQLEDLKNQLNQTFKDMRSTMKKEGEYLTEQRRKQKFQSTDDILTGISMLIQTLDTFGLRGDDKDLDISSFFSEYYPLLNKNLYQNDNQIKAISNFVSQYQLLRDKILDTQELLGATSEKIRGDKMQYGILLERADPSLKGKDAAKLLKLSREQFEQFERQNSDLFELAISKRQYIGPKGEEDAVYNPEHWKGVEGQASKLQLRRGITSSTVYERMKNTFGENFDKESNILDQIYTVNSKGQAVQTRDIYKILFSNSLGKSTNFQDISSGRKLEMLFDKDFRSEVSNFIEKDSNLINGHFSKTNLITQLKNFDTSSYTAKGAENIYGYATGDVNFKIQDQYEAWQLKFKNDFQPWNGAGIQGALDAIDILHTLYNSISNPNSGLSATDNFLSGIGLSMEELEADPRVQQAATEMAYQEVDNMFSSSNEFTITGFI